MDLELPLALRPRPFQEVRDVIGQRARSLTNPCRYTDADEVKEALASLQSTEPIRWAETFSKIAEPYEEKASWAEHEGNLEEARKNFLIAYDYHHLGRFPTINHPAKLESYRKAKENFLRASRFDPTPLERIEIPFQGRESEGMVIPVYFRRPDVPERVPVVVSMGGIDGFKEERQVDEYLKRGIAAITMDMPGVGESPIRFEHDSERLYDPVFAWIRSRPDLDPDRIAVVGNSFGGYWAAKLAHTHREQLRAVVAHGGPMHFMFTEDALHVSHSWYAFEIYETTWYAMGIKGLDEWREKRSQLDMLNLGVIGSPSAELLCVNGASDISAPTSDTLVFPQNEPTASAWFFPGGHMGRGDVRHRIADWVIGKLTNY